MTAPYYADDTVMLYLGDCREVLPSLGLTADLVLADPPYGETSLPWDRWPAGWLDTVASLTSSLWCFGSMRMFLRHGPEFESAKWRLSQDVVWEKNDGSGRATDRFRRVHEHVLHWYQGPWGAIHHDTPRVAARAEQIARNGTAVRGLGRPEVTPHLGTYGAAKAWTDDGTRLARSVLKAPNLRGQGRHKTEKPVPLLVPLITYACPAGGVVLDPFTGSGSTLVAARMTGRRAIGVEAREEYAERAAQRLAQAPLTLEATS